MKCTTESAVVIDNGSYMIKGGFSGDDLPRCVFRPIVGQPKDGDPRKDTYVGDEAYVKQNILYPKRPVIDRGIVTNWDDIEKVWHHTFYNELRLAPENHRVLLTETVFNSMENREKMAQIILETFRSPGVYFGSQAQLSLYASGRTTGVVFDSGDAKTHIVPIKDNVLSHAVADVCISGHDLTQFLMRLLSNHGHCFASRADREVARGIKEKLCCVAANFDQELAMTAGRSDESYKLPDGREIPVRDARFRCTEALFKPHLLGKDKIGGIHEQLLDSVMSCEVDDQKILLSNIVLAGGTTLHQGLPERLRNELDKLGSKGKIEIDAPAHRLYSSWIGGSILSSLDAFSEKWLSKDEYQEEGPSIVGKKFPPFVLCKDQSKCSSWK